MNALAERESQLTPPVNRLDEPANMVTETLFSSHSTQQVCTALSSAQGKFDAPRRTKTATVKLTGGGGYQFSYAPLEEIISAIKVGLSENGLCRQQYLIRSQAGYVIRTIIWHSSGEWLGGDYPVMYQRDGAQGFAGGVTYARRQGLCLMLGLAPEDDDDGNAAEGNSAQISPREQHRQMREAQQAMRQPMPPAENVMSAGNDNTQKPAGYDITKRWDQELEKASKKGTQALQEMWKDVPPEVKPTLKSALDRRHKVVAQAVDAALAQQQQEENPADV